MKENRKEASEHYEKRGYLLTDFKLFHLKDDAGTEVTYHYHEFHKLLLLRSGFGRYFIEGEEYALKAGDVVLVGSRQVHRPEFQKGIPYERIILYIAPEFLKKNSTEAFNLEDIFLEEQPSVLHAAGGKTGPAFLLERLEEEMAEEALGSEVLCKGLLLQFMIEIARAMQKENRKKEHGIGEKAGGQDEAPMALRLNGKCTDKSSRVWEIVKYLELHFSEDITMDFLADKFYVSKYHMMRQFKEETGQAIYDYLTDRRLAHARGLIKQGIGSTESCYSSGFRSYSSFTRAYAKRFGSTPTGRVGHTMKREETYE